MVSLQRDAFRKLAFLPKLATTGCERKGTLETEYRFTQKRNQFPKPVHLLQYERFCQKDIGLESCFLPFLIRFEKVIIFQTYAFQAIRTLISMSIIQTPTPIPNRLLPCNYSWEECLMLRNSALSHFVRLNRQPEKERDQFSDIVPLFKNAPFWKTISFWKLVRLLPRLIATDISVSKQTCFPLSEGNKGISLGNQCSFQDCFIYYQVPW